jgi:hypothetical protein
MRKKRRTTRDDMNAFTRHYRETVCRGAAMREVVLAAQKMGYKSPKPQDSTEIMIRLWTKAQQIEMFVDRATGEEYHANTCYLGANGQYEWIDSDKAKFSKHVESIQRRRNKAVGILVQAEKDNRHWNRMHTADEQYEIVHDLGQDVLIALNQPKIKKEGRG